MFATSCRCTSQLYAPSTSRIPSEIRPQHQSYSMLCRGWFHDVPQQRCGSYASGPSAYISHVPIELVRSEMFRSIAGAMSGKRTWLQTAVYINSDSRCATAYGLFRAEARKLTASSETMPRTCTPCSLPIHHMGRLQ